MDSNFGAVHLSGVHPVRTKTPPNCFSGLPTQEKSAHQPEGDIYQELRSPQEPWVHESQGSSCGTEADENEHYYPEFHHLSVITDKTMPCNRPDITLVDKVKRTTCLIDIAVPNTHNLQQAHCEKLSKYTELAEEVRKMWRMDIVRIIPIVLSSLGVVPRSLHTGLQSLDLPYGTFLLLQKAAILNSAHLVRKFLNLPAYQG